MKDTAPDEPAVMLRRYLVVAATAGVIVLILTLTAMIPFVFQSQTILYKFGADKIVLRLGKIAGLLAAILMLLQILSVSRIGFFESSFTRKRLHRFHTINGLLVVLLALVHPLLVFWPEDIRVLAVEFRFWPEIVGAFLLLLVWLVYLTAAFRTFLRMSAAIWLRWHRVFVHVAVAALLLHILFVSDTFDHRVPRNAAITAAAVYLLLWVRLRVVLFKQRAGRRSRAATERNENT